MEMLYKKMKKLREDNDLTQKEIAEVLEISQQSYSYFESGKREISLRHIKRLAEYYKVSADYLLGVQKNSMESKEFSDSFLPDIGWLRVIEILKRLPQDKRQSLFSYMSYLDEEC